RIKFGPCEIEAPNEPTRYLETFYGEEYDKMLIIKTPSPEFRERFPRKCGFFLEEKPQCYYTLGDPSIKLPFVKDDPYYIGQHKHPVVQKKPTLKKKPAAKPQAGKKKPKLKKKIIKGKKPVKSKKKHAGKKSKKKPTSKKASHKKTKRPRK
ncbi:MAG: hypothetical protein P0S94_04690, partial [Simkaniaceae bacterium]|nr:hypothetical protein [Simkaniaceae bacterium]